MRRRYLFTYDINDDKRGAAIFKTLRDYGDHVQYSVFLCELTARELATLKGLLDGFVHHDHDQVLILDLGPEPAPLERGLECIGMGYEPPSRIIVV